jgi:hypothetical protein
MACWQIFVIFAIFANLSMGSAASLLVNPGFEQVDASGKPYGWTVYSKLDPNGYGAPEYKATFDEVVPKIASDGRRGRCVSFPVDGLWLGKIADHHRPNGDDKVSGTTFGKAAIFQTVTLRPGTYVFGAYLRTADGDAYTACFSLGYNFGDPVAYANDGSTGIHWTSSNLGLKTSFDGTGFLTERGEWYRYQTEPFTLREPGKVTVWIRLNYANNNSMRTRWQIDDCFIEPYSKPSPTDSTSDVRNIRIRVAAGSPLQYPLPGQLMIDCGDYGERYLVSDNGSTLLNKIPGRIFQHARCVTGSKSFTYSIPVDSHKKFVYLAFEHMGPVKVTVGSRVAIADPEAREDVLYPKQYLLTDRSLWCTGHLEVKFESAVPNKKLALVWLEVGETTRFRERLFNIEWDTVGVPWQVGLWDGSPSEFRGDSRLFVVGQKDYSTLSAQDQRIEWVMHKKPGHRYYLVLGYMNVGSDGEPGYGQINISDDEIVEWISKTKGEEAFDVDVTDYIQSGKNVVSVRAEAIDYVALIEVLPGIVDNRKLKFYIAGDELADNLTRVYHNTLFWIINMHYDETGFVDASVPHGKWWQQYWPIDIAFAMRVLLYWGFLDQCERISKLVVREGWLGHFSNRSGGADNNGGNILATDMCELIQRRRFDAQLTALLWPKIRAYCDQICDSVATSPFGLIKGTNWENAGNREQGPSYALTTNLTACWLLLKAALTAEEGNLSGDVSRWQETAKRIRGEVLNHLVFKEDVASPSGWVYPKGTWAYGLLDDGSYMLQPLAGYLWAGKLGVGYYGFIDPDKEVRDLYSRTVEVAVPLFLKRQVGLVSGYATSYDGPETVFASAALSDNLQAMNQLLDELKGPTDYEKDIGQPRAEISRWAYGPPGWEEDTNLVCASEFLDVPRYIVGIDDLLYKGSQLRLIPRLPKRWNTCGVNDWTVQYLQDGKRFLTKLAFCYTWTTNQASARIQTADPVKGVTVRLGPFPDSTKFIIANVDGRRVSYTREISGGQLWVWVKVNTSPLPLTVNVQAK